MLNYPLKFYPILKDRIWGGDKLVAKLNKKSDLKDIGESWEISDVDGNISVVSNGLLKGKTLREILTTYTTKLVGEKNYRLFGNNFPLLIKFIDAHQDLSVQVHPNNALSKKRHNSFGKTEMWYIMQADKGAQLVLGFNKTITGKEYISLLKEKKITTVLNHEYVEKGDAFFIETGTVHAIGAGVVLAEIQQTSDITYRIYDWDRVDDHGISRELHTNLAIDALNFNSKIETKRCYSNELNTLNSVVTCEYFKTNVVTIEGVFEIDYSKTDSFVIFMCVEGSAEITIFNNSEIVEFGETILIPATVENIRIESKNCKLLEVTVP